ncbi:MAG: VWA domain-containing protein [Bdellovibrionota bacterium]
MLILNLAKTVFKAGLLLLLTAACFNLYADKRDLDPKSSESLDAILVLDASGSMRITDPARLRDEGAKLFLQFLKPGDRLGIIEFSDKAKVIRPLSDFDRGASDVTGAEIAKAGNSGLYTDLFSGIQAAAEMLKSKGRQEANQVIILLSDGKMDPEPSKGSPYMRSLELKNNYLPDLKSKSIKIHTLSFSDRADKDLLAEIALATDGVNWFTPDAETIHESFADLFLVVKKPQVLPLTSKGFRIDPDIKEATFYINREGDEEISLVRPSGGEVTPKSKVEDVQWYRSNKFDIITVHKPEAGSWQLVGLPKNSGYATVITNLRLTTDWPSSVYAGYNNILQARLYDNEKAIDLPTMTSEIRYAFQITPTDKISEPIIRETLHDDGKHGDKIAKDGVFASTVLLNDPGEYKLKIVASGPTFERYLHIPFRVKPRRISVEIVAVLVGDAGHGGHSSGSGHEDQGHAGAGHTATDSHGDSSTHDYIRILLSPEVASFKKVKISLIAIDEKKKRYNIPVKKAEDSLRYEAPASVLPKDGKYILQAFLEAEGKRKTRVNDQSLIVEYTKHTAKIDEHQEEVLELAKEPEGPPPPESPLIYIILVTLANLGVGAYGVMQISKNQSNVETGGEVKFADVGQYNQALEGLSAKLLQEEVDLNDPIFTEENIQKAKAALSNIDSALLSTTGSESEAVDESADSEASEADSTDADSSESSDEAEVDEAEVDEAEDLATEEAESETEEADAEVDEENQDVEEAEDEDDEEKE